MPPVAPVVPGAPQAAQAGGVAGPAPTPPPIAPSGAPLSSAPQVSPVPANPIQGVTQPNAPGVNLGDISKFYGIPTQTAGVVNQAKTQGNIAQQQYERQVAQTQLQQQNTQDKLDAGKYKVIQTDGGTRILDPTGQEVSIGEYASRTGANPADVLKNSTNPQDQQFVQDYNNFQSFMNAAMNKGTSKEAAQVYQSYLDANPGLENLSPQQAGSQFLAQYGNYFGLNQALQTPTSNQYTPQYQPNIEQYYAEKALLATNPPGYPSVTTSGSSTTGGTGSAYGTPLPPNLLPSK